jgi:protein transport protein SEC61 subunit gamma and related proteins
MDMSKLRSFYKEAMRVLRITKKPSKDEYISIVKVTGLGCIVIGLIGFTVFLLSQLI